MAIVAVETGSRTRNRWRSIAGSGNVKTWFESTDFVGIESFGV
ncbi:MAG: hypothetical protein ACKN89_15605 [Cyanobium sp.]